VCLGQRVAQRQNLFRVGSACGHAVFDDPQDHHRTRMRALDLKRRRMPTLDNHGIRRMKIDGHCHCGEIAFEAEVDPNAVNICHCTDCQTLSGSAFRINIPAPAEHFVLLSGTPKSYVKTAESGNQRLLRQLRHADLRLRGGEPAELWLARRYDHAARSLFATATRLAAFGAALGERARRGAGDRERLDRLKSQFFTQPQPRAKQGVRLPYQAKP
jgi:Glutathione-dependent formaldehyde-activating enzyme